MALGALALATLFTVKATFLAYMGLVAAAALWELAGALTVREVRLPLAPVAAGGAAAWILAYWQGERPLVAAAAVTVIVILAWRLPGGAAGYLRDVMAGVFAFAYLPLMASFAALMLAASDGSWRVLLWVLLTVCSDIGGYFAGVLLGKHPMAPAISPKKTWEGFGGSVAACLVAGGLGMTLMLHGSAWQGVVVGAGALAAATLGDLAASMLKRDLGIKDWGVMLPGHGGVLDRIDSLLITAPVVWLLLSIFLPASV